MSERKAMDIMEKVFVTADPSTTVLDLIQLFIKNKITSIPIVNDDGTLAGIVTDADLLYKKIKCRTMSIFSGPVFTTTASVNTIRALKNSWPVRLKN